MYRCPSMSWRYCPSALAMNGGSPPTVPNARAGLFTPPGITRLARANASWLLGRWKSGRDRAGVVEFITRVALHQFLHRRIAGLGHGFAYREGTLRQP